MRYRVLTVVVLIAMLLTCNGCIVEMYEEYQRDQAKKENQTTEAESTVDVQAEALGTLFGIVMDIDTDKKIITICDVNTDEIVSYSYTGSTDIRDKYDKVMAVALMEPGHIVEGEYYEDNNRLAALSLSDKAWENHRVHNWQYSQEEGSFRIANQYYRMYESLVAASDGEIIDMLELAEVDELIVRGYEDTIYSITILKGHGYVSLKNDAYFMGGIVTVGNDAGYEVTEDMLIMVGEGEHTLSVSKGGVGGSVKINVERNKEIVVDIGEFQGEVEEYGSISFTIKPEGASLYIDGRKKDYDELVELAMGTYKIAVEAEGYVPYIGDLVVNDTFIKRNISLGLEAEKATTGDSEDETTTSGEEESTTDGDIEEETTDVDREGETTTTDIDVIIDSEEETTVIYTGDKDVSKYSIYIETPAGAEVYFDSEYIGVSPVEIPKQSGMHTIILKREGYKTKAYTIEISDEARDEHFSFTPMIIEEE